MRLLEDAQAEMRLLDLAPVELDLREVLDVNVAMLEGLSPSHAIAHATPPDMRVTRIASGLPVGGDLEYADELTLGRALEGRRDVEG